MKKRLEKKNRVTTDFVEIITEEHLLRIRSGKVGKAGNSTKHCGTSENCLKEGQEILNNYTQKQYVEVEFKDEDNYDGVFDKAKWHYGGDFPKELENYQAYVHTGFFITWLIEHNLFESNFIKEEKLEDFLNKVNDRQFTGAKFYEECLDGKFWDDFTNETGTAFTRFYYDLEKGNYTKDLSEIISSELPTLYHIQDTWENYDKLKTIIDKRFGAWMRANKKNWWEFWK